MSMKGLSAPLQNVELIGIDESQVDSPLPQSTLAFLRSVAFRMYKLPDGAPDEVVGPILHKELQNQSPDVAALIAPLTTHGLPDDVEAKRISKAYELLGKTPEELAQVVANIQRNHEIRAIEARLANYNSVIQQELKMLMNEAEELGAEAREFCHRIIELIELPEREHRFQQVREHVARSILALL